MKHAQITAPIQPGGHKIAWAVIGALIACGNIVFCLYISDSRSVMLVGFGLIAVSLIVFLISNELRRRDIITINGMIVIFVLACGVYYLAVFPPFTVPDEPYHYIASYMLANDLMGEPASLDGIAMRNSDLAFLLDYVQNKYVTLEIYQQMLQGQPPVSDGAAITVYDFTDEWPAAWPSRMTNLPQYKFVTVLALVLGRLFGLDGFVSFYLGRVFALVFFAVLAYLALRITPVATKVFAVIFLLPITLHLAGSYSYDSPMLGYCFVLIALYLRAIYKRRKISNGLVAATIIVAALAIPCKFIYICLCFAGFLVPRKKFTSSLQAALYRFGPFAAGLILVALFRLASFANYVSSSVDSNRGEGVGYSLGDLIRNPIGMALIVVRTLYFQADFFMITTVGGSLGWLQADLVAPMALVTAIVVILAFSTIRVAHQPANLKASQRLVFFLIFVAVLLLAIASMLFGDTLNTEPIAMGVQGRYFLPALPLLLLACQNGVIVMKRDYTLVFIGLMLLINTMYPAIIFAHGLWTAA